MTYLQKFDNLMFSLFIAIITAINIDSIVYTCYRRPRL